MYVNEPRLRVWHNAVKHCWALAHAYLMIYKHGGVYLTVYQSDLTYF